MSIPIKVYSDYVCPFCFLAEFPLKEAVQGKDVEVEWMPFELRPAPNPTLRPEGQYLQQAWRNSVYPMAEGMGVEIRLPRVSPQPHTDLAFEGYQYAKERDKGNEYNDRILRAFFQEEQDIGNLDALVKLAGEIGLDETDFRNALVSHKFRETHQQALNHAQEIGVEAVPTFIIGNRVLTGVQDRETLERAIEEASEVKQQI
jgi:predicted DsbA family dithiol-disulfide isomerase